VLWRKPLWRKGLWVSAYKRDSGGALSTQLAQAPEGTTHQVRSKTETSFSQSQMLHCWIARRSDYSLVKILLGFFVNTEKSNLLYTLHFLHYCL
jgi:hypothetical protein